MYTFFDSLLKPQALLGNETALGGEIVKWMKSVKVLNNFINFVMAKNLMNTAFLQENMTLL